MPLSKIKTNSIADEVFESGSNFIINGGMTIAQRSVSETAQHTTGYITCDRFNISFVNEDELRQTITQASDGPSGFSKSLKLQTTTAESAVAADEAQRIIYRAEGQDLQSLGFGTSAAKKFTVSFYVKSSVAATYGFNAYIYDANKVFGQAYTINSANTWERKSITFDANTASGITDDNTAGLQLNWFLMAGSNYTSGSNSSWETFATAKSAVGHTANAVATTTNATWQITGVQMEIGSSETPFQHEDIETTLAKCQRYYCQIVGGGEGSGANKNIANAHFYTSSYVQGILQLPVTMRATPSVVQTTGSGYYGMIAGGTAHTFNSFVLDSFSHRNAVAIYNSGSVSGTSGDGGLFYSGNASAALGIDAEL